MAVVNFDIAGQQDLQWRQWQTIDQDFHLTDELGADIDLTGCEIDCQIRSASPNVSDPLVAPTMSIKVAATGGVVNMALTSAQTGPMSAGTSSYKYDIFVTFPGGEIIPFVFGNITVDASVTILTP